MDALHQPLIFFFSFPSFLFQFSILTRCSELLNKMTEKKHTLLPPHFGMMANSDTDGVSSIWSSPRLAACKL